jgi:pimeloyl-ACP methyl ester carboxylesterase
LLLHGYPGNEKNLDVAQALRSNGWNVVFFHYRGAWGSEGEFSFLNAEEDVQTVLKYMNMHADTLRIDKDLISIVGHSMGGHMAIAGILDNPSVTCAITYDGANMGVNDVGIAADPETTIPWKAYSDTVFMLNAWSGEKALNELKEHSKALNLVRRVNSINSRPVLLIAADTDVIPMKSHITPLLEALRNTKNSKISYKLINDDHSFNASRAELISTSISFLNSNCK